MLPAPQASRRQRPPSRPLPEALNARWERFNVRAASGRAVGTRFACIRDWGKCTFTETFGLPALPPVVKVGFSCKVCLCLGYLGDRLGCPSLGQCWLARALLCPWFEKAPCGGAVAFPYPSRLAETFRTFRPLVGRMYRMFLTRNRMFPGRAELRRLDRPASEGGFSRKPQTTLH